MITANPKQEPEAGAKERLLDAALDLFNDRGYAASSVREIVQAAGVTKPVLYYYFGNKEGIYLALMEGSYHTFESVAADIGALEGSAQDKVLRFCTTLLQSSQEKLPLVRLMYAIYYGPPQGAPRFDLEVFWVRMMEVVRQVVADGVASGEFRQNTVEDVARAIIAIVSSTINEQLSRRENKPDAETMVRMLRLLMAGIAS